MRSSQREVTKPRWPRQAPFRRDKYQPGLLQHYSFLTALMKHQSGLRKEAGMAVGSTTGRTITTFVERSHTNGKGSKYAHTIPILALLSLSVRMNT